MSLLVDVYDDPDSLLAELSPEAIFPSGLALEGFLRNRDSAILGQGPRLLRDLWRELSQEEYVGDLLFREILRQEIADMPLLGVLEDRDLGELQSHLDRISNETCGEIKPTTDLEAELRNLARRLQKRGVYSESSWRLQTALRAEEAKTGPLLFAPVPAPSRQLGMLLQGLAKHNDVRLLLLLSEQMIEPYLRGAGISGEIRTHFQRSGAMPWGEPGAPDRQVRILQSRSTALSELEGDLLASPSPFRDWRELWPETKMLFRVDFSARETPLGSRMLRAALENNQQEEFLPGESERDLLWYESWRREQEALGELPVRDELLLDNIYSRRLWRGEGPPLLAPGEVPLQRPGRLVFWGLDADRYPLPEAPSPFFSSELLRRHPELQSKDKRPTFVSALLAARQEIILIHSGSPSSFILECQRVWSQEPEAWQERGQRLRDLARQGPCTPQLRKMSQAWQVVDPDPPEGRTYSVTELEAFLRCPLGWFVRYRLRPRVQPSPEQELGLRLHLVLQRLYELPDSERAKALPDLLGPDLEEWQGKLEKVLGHYSHLLPGAKHILEIPLEAEIPFEDGQVVLRGRADRIDVAEEGILLVDWKTSSLPGMNPQNLQAALYPYLAAGHLGKEPLGFLYVSLRTGESQGLTTRPILAEIDSGWRSFSQRAMQKAEEAISQIEAGQWRETGERCQSWCPHHLLSQTGVRLG